MASEAVIAVIECPVLGCDWSDLRDDTPVDPMFLAEVFGPGVMAVTEQNRRMKAAEDNLRRHLEGHSVLDWAATVGALRRQLDEAERGT